MYKIVYIIPINIYIYTYIILYVGNMCVGTCCMCVEEFSFFHSTPYLCVKTCNCYIYLAFGSTFIVYIVYIAYVPYAYIAMYVSHVAPIRNKLCTRGGGVEGLQQSGPPSHTHSTTTGRNVTEATIKLSQCNSSDIGN